MVILAEVGKLLPQAHWDIKNKTYIPLWVSPIKVYLSQVISARALTANTMTMHFSFLPLFLTVTKVPDVQWDITEGLSLSSTKVRPVSTGIFTG